MEKEARQLRIGVLGCGPIAQAAHFEACRRAHNAELYAICDLAEDLVTRMAAIHEPHVTYQDYGAMLADPQVEAVIVATADQFHVEHASRALAAGKHVLVEKPLGVTVEECEALHEQAQRFGLLVQVGTMKRFDPGIAFARQFIKEDMGQLLALKAWYCDSTYRHTMTDNLQPILVTSAYARRPVGDPKANKRRYYLLGHGSHLVDTARFLGGEIVRVQARFVQKFGAYCWFVATEFADGSVGHLDLTMAVRMDWHEGFQVYGEYGSVIGKTPPIPGICARVKWSASACVMGSTTGCSVRMRMSIGCNLRASRTRFCMVRLCMVQVSKTAWQHCGLSSRSRALSKREHGFHWPMS